MAPKYTASIMACARWETQYITEWLLYHRSIGFDHVYLYCNDDDPADLYGEILPFCSGEAPFVTFHHFPYQGQQFYMMMHGLRHHGVETEWVAFLDIDEFLVLPVLENIKRYLGVCAPHWDAIHINRVLFGNNFHETNPVGSVLRAYTRRENRLHHSTKTIARSARIDLSRITRKAAFWQSWNGVFGADFVAINVVGDPMGLVIGSDGGADYIKSPETEARIRSAAVINHYAFKSVHDYERKTERGRPRDFANQMIASGVVGTVRNDARLQALNAVEDRYLADYWDRQVRNGRQSIIVPVPQLPNVAVGKRADQSSRAVWAPGRTPQENAAGALSGRITGGAQIHTELEAGPWWSVDLGATHLIYDIRVFNRVDEPSLRARLGAFHIEVANAAGDWTTIYENDGSTLIGGADGDPLIIRPRTPLTMSRMRIVAHASTYLHLDQVQLHGILAGDVASDVVTLSPPPEDAALGRPVAIVPLNELMAPVRRPGSSRIHMQHQTCVTPAGSYTRRVPTRLDAVDLAPDLTVHYASLMGQTRQEYADVFHIGLAGAVVFGQGTVLTAEGIVIRDSCWEFFAQGREPPGLSQTGPTEYRFGHLPSRRIEAPTLLLKRPFWRNYGHWLIDAAMLLALLPDLDLPAGWQIVVGWQGDPRMRSIVSETLGILAPGIPVIEHADHDVWSFNALQYVMPVQISPLTKLPRALAQLRAAILVGRVRPSRRRRLYILRSGDRRRLENEAEVIGIAQRYGFETIRPEDYSLREQAALFQSAECVMGVKGAAFANIMFCAGTASVLMLSPSDWIDPIFWDIAGQLGVGYSEIFGPVTATIGAPGENPFRVDTGRLETMVAAMCEMSSVPGAVP